MKKNFLLSFIILIILLVGVGFFYFIFSKTKSNSNLTTFLPEETIIYIQYNLQEKNLLILKEKNNLNFLSWQKTEQELKIFDILPQEIKKEIKTIGYVLINKNNQQQEMWLLETNNIKKILLSLDKDYYSSVLTGGIVAVAKEKETLNSLKFSGYNNLNKDLADVLKKFSADNFLNIYLGSEYLQSLPQDNIFLFLKNLDLKKPIFFGLGVADENIFFKSESMARENNKQLFIADGLQPIDSQQNLFFIFKSANGQEFLSSLSELNFLPKINLEQIKNIFQNNILFFTESKNNKILFQDFFNLKKYNYGLALHIGDNQNEAEIIKLTEDILKNILAFNYPQRKSINLPDGSTAVELIADSSVFEFKKDEQLETLNYNKINVSLAIKYNYLFITNNFDLLKNILAQQENNKKKNINTKGQEFFYLNSQQINDGLLSLFSNIQASAIQDGEIIKIEGFLNY